MGCLFCDIISGKIKAEFVFQDDDMVAFRDINPKSPVHILLVPKKHIINLASVREVDAKILGRLLLSVKTIAQKQGLSDGYRTVINCGSDAGQAVEHLHIHIMGGRKFGWPPG